ncbi:cryptochrome/photolyase family protein [Acetobacter okinawensis]|uniref:cryptochrome/photolyase family protein n=1 Tax=Acetobacter okinawensis TaxID=1076594 RepID=UPI000470777E|nr:deoxyribodipyrimidine photo-lyase [Acetobacter okinawensis]
MSGQSPVLVWFRDDLRLSDNLALSRAVQSGQPLLCVVVRSTAQTCTSALDWWRMQGVQALDHALRARGGQLHVFAAQEEQFLPELVRQSGCTQVFWNRRYDPAGKATDTQLKAQLRQMGVTVHSTPGSLLHEPWTVRSKAGQAFQVFGAFWRAASSMAHYPAPLPAPTGMVFAPCAAFPAQRVALDHALGRLPAWARAMQPHYVFSEQDAHARLQDFIAHALQTYAQERDFPDRDATSDLSPFLRTGQITPGQIWHAVSAQGATEGASKFLSEIGWREFAWSLLWEHPDLSTRNLKAEFDTMPLRVDPKGLARWQQGRTGYPLVDAGMRQLWQTGLMHNRVRMVVASFLVKHLLIDWREGERWFAHTLVDYDPASNPMNWQWNAGTGVESAPFFRIMNPILQSQKFDPDGAYIRTWVPELAGLSGTDIHTPWQARLLQPTGYPSPMVEHTVARARALAAWKAQKDSA